MSSDSPPAKKPKTPNTGEPRREPAAAPDSPTTEISADPLFRSALFLWLRDEPARSALGVLSAILKQSLAQLPLPDTDPIEARLRAIIRELSFLAHFLTYAVDGREERYVGPDSWDLAVAAGEAAAKLVGWLEHLCAATGQPIPDLDVNGWEKALAVRETALWHADGTDQASAIRRIGQMALINAREIKASEPDDTPSSATTQTAEAAIADMLHLAGFVGETAQTLEESASLRRVLEALEFRLARVAEELCGWVRPEAT